MTPERPEIHDGGNDSIREGLDARGIQARRLRRYGGLPQRQRVSPSAEQWGPSES